MKLVGEEAQDGEAMLVNHKLPGAKLCGRHGHQLRLLHYLRSGGVLPRAFWDYRDGEKPVMISLTVLRTNDILTTARTRFS